jgi:hypothetical protein
LSDLPPSRGRALAVCLLSLSLLAALAPSAAANPLTTQPEPAITMPVAVVSGASTALAAAAAAGAGGAVDGFLGDTVEGAAEALSVVATTALPERGAPSSARTDQVPAGDRAPWSGWQSGAAGPEAADGSFATYRGSPLGVVSVWCDSTAEAQTQLDAVDDYADYNGQMDVAVGALVTDETWKQAAAGDFVQRWTTAMQNLKAKRAGKGTTYVRIAHEFNGDWMTWGVNASNVADYIKGYRLYASIVRKVFPQAKLTWSPNSGNHNTLTMDQMWPGSDVVDVIGPDDYDGYPPYTSAAVWNATVNSWLTPGLTPRGLGRQAPGDA